MSTWHAKFQCNFNRNILYVDILNVENFRYTQILIQVFGGTIHDPWSSEEILARKWARSQDYIFPIGWLRQAVIVGEFAF